MFFVYVLRSNKDKSFYIGFAPKLRERLEKHSLGLVESTKNIRPVELIYFEGYKSKKDAPLREKQLERFARGFGILKCRIQNSLLML